jgi:hypothetical protein
MIALAQKDIDKNTSFRGDFEMVRGGAKCETLFN